MVFFLNMSSLCKLYVDLPLYGHVKISIKVGSSPQLKYTVILCSGCWWSWLWVHDWRGCGCSWFHWAKLCSWHVRRNSFCAWQVKWARASLSCCNKQRIVIFVHALLQAGRGLWHQGLVNGAVTKQIALRPICFHAAIATELLRRHLETNVVNLFSIILTANSYFAVNLSVKEK